MCQLFLLVAFAFEPEADVALPFDAVVALVMAL
jgi:hypothetical protein